ncbi:GNAT family N-acetyltransferase [Rhizobium sp. RHZ02]|nr:acetyltransferase (GNAT) family protein [Rhizobium sp. 57MFTsu3.2]
MGVTWFWFWVEQEFRGLGVATKLMSKAVAYLKSRG